MADSAVQIANLALVRLGEQPITGLDDDTDRARVMNTLYLPTLDAMIRAHGWNFAQRRVALAALTADPVWGFDYQYQLPQDPFCLDVIATNLEDDEEYRIETVVSGSTTYRVIVTDATSLSILYLARIEDVTLWDTLFADAMAVELAYRACYAITANASLKAEIAAELKEAWRRAKGRDGQEGRTLASWRSDSLTSMR